MDCLIELQYSYFLFTSFFMFFISDKNVAQFLLSIVKLSKISVQKIK